MGWLHACKISLSQAHIVPNSLCLATLCAYLLLSREVLASFGLAHLSDVIASKAEAKGDRR